MDREERYEEALQKLSSVSFLLDKLLELDQTCEYEYLRVISNEVKEALAAGKPVVACLQIQPCPYSSLHRNSSKPSFRKIGNALHLFSKM